MELEVGDVVSCTVDRIIGTIVFVKIDNKKINGIEIEGSIIVSEIAPGRIRNLRNYVVPKKKIICKILRISQTGNIDLSLRRVSLKERKELTEKLKQEKSYIGILKGILKEKTDEVIKEILSYENVYDFLEEAKEDSSKLEKIIGIENSNKIIEILKTQKQKRIILKKYFSLKTSDKEGLFIIKKLLDINHIKDKEKPEIKYISAGKYSIKIESEDIKSADNKLKEITSEIEKKAKKNNAEFSIIEK